MDSNLFGYFCVFIVNALNILSNYLSKKIQKNDQPTVDIIISNSSKIMPFLLLLSSFEYQNVIQMNYHLSDNFLLLASYLAMMAFTSYLYNVMFFKVHKGCSHFSVCIAGIFKDFVLTFLGTYLF
jgi:hypothetical protein